MDGTTGRGRAALLEDGVEFDDDDAALLRAIGRTGSVAEASSKLGRSRARALSRIQALEAAFGELVERRRGGSGGGGSRLTEAAIRLLNRYDRLAAALAATAQVPETVLEGTVTAVTGELAAVETAVGTVDGLHDGLRPDAGVQVRIGADAITILDPGGDPEPDSTSARNRLSGTVTGVDRGETVSEIDVDVSGTVFRALITDESASRLGIRTGERVAITWKATATRLVGRTHSEAS
jgi:molybdate transport system regulatory protein